MLEKAKSPVIILVVLLLVSLVFAGGSFFLFQKEHAKNLSLTEELDEIKTRLKITEAKLDESKKLLFVFETKIKETQNHVEEVSKSLEEERGAKEMALAQNEQLRLELDSQKSLRSDLEDKLNKAQEDVRNAQNQLVELESKKAELEGKISELQAKSSEIENKTQGIELGKIVVNKQEKKKSGKGFFGLFGADKPKEKKAVPASKVTVPDSGTANQYVNAPAYSVSSGPAGYSPDVSYAPPSISPDSGLEGKVLVVNKDYNFAVINLGARDGVAAGDVFSFYKGDRSSGKAKVGKVHDSMAALDFLSADMRETVSEGDRAIRQSE